MKTSAILIFVIFLFLNSCALMRTHKVDGQAVVRSDGQMGMRLEIMPRHQPTDIR
jgi:hypothetical protein